MKKLTSVIFILSILLLGVLNIFASQNKTVLSEAEPTSTFVDAACASGSCKGEPGNICDLYSEWIIDQCNDNGFMPCKVIE